MTALRLGEEWRSDVVLIEKAASGTELLQDCRQENPARYLASTLHQDKIIRFNKACAPIEAGNILLPRNAAWLEAYKRELQSFPRGRFDDQVDSTSQFLNWYSGNGFWRALRRDHPLNRERHGRRRRRIREARC